MSQRTAPPVAVFVEGLQAQRLRISAKSRLGEKLTYTHRQWDGLQTFLSDGRVEIDSDAAENLIRPIALTEKNALFAGHDEGAKALGRIATANVYNLERFAHLKATLEAIAAGHWTFPVLVPLQVLFYATFRLKATGLFQPSAEFLRRGL